LGDLADEVTGVLNAAGFTVRGVRRSPAFARPRVESAECGVEIGLVADLVPRIDAPERAHASGLVIEIDSKQEIFAHKFDALLSHSEFRDLVDVEALMSTGLDLRSGLEAAARKDGAMSAATLAWVLSSLPVAALAQPEGSNAPETLRVARFHVSLCAELARLSAPG
jgi:hypothetical protein